ncbi:MAG: hypothetical protein ACKO7P_06615, partial [Bacteroidota bacterium]
TELSNISRIIKSESNKLLAINESGYELIKNKPLTKYKSNVGNSDSTEEKYKNNFWSYLKSLWS